MPSIRQDLRYAIRRLKETPGFTAAAILTLALGLGLNSAVLSIAHAIFLQPLPLSDPSRLVLVDETHPGRPTTAAYPLSYPDYLYYRDHARAFEGLAAHYATSPMHVSLPEGGFSVLGSVVTANYFNVLRLRPNLGRFFTDDEDRVPGRSPVGLLGHDLWRSRYGADAGVIGTVSDRTNGPRVAIVNETLARHFWPTGRATGNQITVAGAGVEIVGVAKDLQFLSALEHPEPMVYFNFWQQDTANNWSHDSRTHVRVAGDAATMLPQILRAIAAVDADVPVSDAMPLGTRLDDAFSEVRVARALLVTFGVLAFVLSAIGLYAALSFAVGQRTREIGIRMALGAGRIDVGRPVVGRGAAIVVIGSVAGLFGSAMAAPLLAHLLYSVNPHDPLTLLTGPSLLAPLALLAIWLPARRAMAMDPMAALRSE
jgi:FtsX-like permease family/MacB-like periplasmic core domain